MGLESSYQAELMSKLTDMFPDCFVFRNDPDQYQGVPDLLILFEDKWAMLEVKRSESEPFQPNQEYYIEKFGEMSFTAVIFPENEFEVLEELLIRFGG